MACSSSANAKTLAENPDSLAMKRNAEPSIGWRDAACHDTQPDAQATTIHSDETVALSRQPALHSAYGSTCPSCMFKAHTAGATINPAQAVTPALTLIAKAGATNRGRHRSAATSG